MMLGALRPGPELAMAHAGVQVTWHLPLLVMQGILLPNIGTFRVGPVVGETKKKIRPAFSLLETRYQQVSQERPRYMIGKACVRSFPIKGLKSHRLLLAASSICKIIQMMCCAGCRRQAPHRPAELRPAGHGLSCAPRCMPARGGGAAAAAGGAHPLWQAYQGMCSRPTSSSTSSQPGSPPSTLTEITAQGSCTDRTDAKCACAANVCMPRLLVQLAFPGVGRMVTNKANRVEFVFDPLLMEFFEDERHTIIPEVCVQAGSVRTSKRVPGRHARMLPQMHSGRDACMDACGSRPT